MEDDIVSWDFDAPKFYDFQHPEQSSAKWNDSWFATHTPETSQTRNNRLRLRGRRPMLPPPSRPIPKKGATSSSSTTINEKTAVAAPAAPAAPRRLNTTTAAATATSTATTTRRDIFSALAASKATAPSSSSSSTGRLQTPTAPQQKQKQKQKQQHHHHPHAKATTTQSSSFSSTTASAAGSSTARFAQPTAASISKSRTTVPERRDVAVELKRITERFIKRKPSQSELIVTPSDKPKQVSKTNTGGNRDDNNKENVPPHERSRSVVPQQQQQEEGIQEQDHEEQRSQKQQQEEQDSQERTREEQRSQHREQQRIRREIPILPSEREYLSQHAETAPISDEEEEEQELSQEEGALDKWRSIREDAADQMTEEERLHDKDTTFGIVDNNRSLQDELASRHMDQERLQDTTVSTAGNGRSLHDELAIHDNERLQRKYDDTTASRIEEQEESDDMWLQETTHDTTMASRKRGKTLRQEENPVRYMDEEELLIPEEPMRNVNEELPRRHRDTFAAQEPLICQNNNTDDEGRILMDKDNTAIDSVEQESHQDNIITTSSIHQRSPRRLLASATNIHTGDPDQQEESTEGQQDQERMRCWLDDLPSTRLSTATTTTMQKHDISSAPRSPRLPTIAKQTTTPSSIYDTPEQSRYESPQSPHKQRAPTKPSLLFSSSSPLPVTSNTTRLSTNVQVAATTGENVFSSPTTATAPTITSSFDALFQRMANIRSSLLHVARTSAIKPATSDLIRNMKKLEGLVGSSSSDDGPRNPQQQQPSPALSDASIIEQRIARARRVIEESKRASQLWFVKDANKPIPPLLPRATMTESNINVNKRKSLTLEQQEDNERSLSSSSRPSKIHKTLSTSSTSDLMQNATTTRRDSMQHNISVAERVERLKQSASRRASRVSFTRQYLPIEPTKPKGPTFATDARSKSSSRSYHY